MYLFCFSQFPHVKMFSGWGGGLGTGDVVGYTALLRPIMNFDVWTICVSN